MVATAAGGVRPLSNVIGMVGTEGGLSLHCGYDSVTVRLPIQSSADIIPTFIRHCLLFC